MEKKYKQAKWLSGEALQIGVKRRKLGFQSVLSRFSPKKQVNTEMQKARYSNQVKKTEKKKKKKENLHLNSP